jgi:hypothetical protein
MTSAAMSTSRAVFRATCAILPLGIREGDIVVTDGTGYTSVSRSLDATPAALAPFVASGVLAPLSAPAERPAGPRLTLCAE